MDQPMGEQSLRHSLYLRPEFSGQTHGRDLAKTAHFDHLIVPFGGPRNFKVPFRMSDDGGDSVRDQLEKDFFPLIRKRHRIKFDHQETAVVIDRYNLPVFTKLKKVCGEMDIGAGKDPEFGIRSAEFGMV